MFFRKTAIVRWERWYSMSKGEQVHVGGVALRIYVYMFFRRLFFNGRFKWNTVYKLVKI